MREWPVSEPITGIAACCACAADGHTAAPATSVMNSRRLIVAPRGQSHALHRVTAVRVLKRAERDVNCDQLFWAANVGFGSHDRVKTGKTQNRKWFPLCPRKRNYLPILELLPPPTLANAACRPRASARSRASACGPLDGQRPASTSKANPPARRAPS